MKPITVNDAIARSILADSPCLAVEGILCSEFESITLSHWPKAERGRVASESGIWLDPHGPVFDFDPAVLSRWAGKRVVVLGILERAVKKSTMDGNSMGFGHFSLWETRICARRIDLLKRWRKDHPEDPMLE